MKIQILAPLLLLLFSSGCWREYPGNTPEEKIDYVITSAYADGDFSGTVLVVRDSTVLYNKSFGFADAEKEIPNSHHTRFLLASVSKPFTAVLILQLIGEGGLTLTHTVADFFPEVKNPELLKITIHHLLSHTSGINDFVDLNGLKTFEPDHLMDVSTAFEPGEDFEYSSPGYILLAAIVERVSGQSFESPLHEKIFGPLGMTRSGLARQHNFPDSLATGYARDGDLLVPSPLPYPIEITDGAGSIYSTVEDLYKFDRALYTDSLLTKENRERMFSHIIPNRFGYGWFLNEQGGVYYPWHTGEMNGATTAFVRPIQRNECIVILSNLENAGVTGMRQSILSILKDAQ